ncbi:hypothetical protein DNTS_015050 [Danionella cerebrum]|uniref:Multiple inositol polyphosphate phosphatase 1 n=1 Tax=Danionella cerebrum TaxID=2873325 RepID=A0A553QPI6_9TELE|nr:hypothetical protein DNTS_015050 [Danionella translucida]
MSSPSIHSSASKTSSIPAIASYFGTKGRYEEVNKYLIDDILAINTSLVNLPSPECREVHLTAIIRHGTRFPTTKNIEKMRQFHMVVRNASLNLSGLSEWKMWYTQDMDGRLVEKGREDHRHLAQRLIAWFPSLLNRESLSGGRVKLVTSSKHSLPQSIN